MRIGKDPEAGVCRFMRLCQNIPEQWDTHGMHPALTDTAGRSRSIAFVSPGRAGTQRGPGVAPFGRAGERETEEIAPVIGWLCALRAFFLFRAMQWLKRCDPEYIARPIHKPLS